MFHCDEPNCLESFSKEGWLARHKEKSHGVLHEMGLSRTPLECEVCNRTFKTPSKLAQHKKIHG